VALNPLEVVGGIAIGEGVGGAIGAVVEPQLQGLKNDQWKKHPDVPPDAMTLALGVAQGQVAEAAARRWAKENGFDDDAFTALIEIANVGPGTAYAFELWRRDFIDEAGFRRALKRLGWEQEWITGVVKLKNELLSPDQIAVMVQRGILRDPGYLPVGPPTREGRVPPMPVANIPTEDEAAGSGYTHERMAALTRIVGLPASPDLAARMVFRGIIDRIDFDRAIAEGNTRNEWARFLFDGFREILTAHQYAELELRGYLTREQRLDGTDKHGMSHADSDHLFDVLGRSIPVKQIVTGFARGGQYEGGSDGIPEAYLRSLQRGNLRPEYYDLAYANRYTYPSGFMIRGLAEDGELSQAETERILLEVGWRPDLADKFSKRWTGGVGAVADPSVKKAQTHLWTATHRSFVAHEAGDGEARAQFNLLGIPAEAHDEILILWAAERDLTRKQLTAAQVKKAYAKPVTNPATGQPWTFDDALAALLDRGWGNDDARTFLAE
jgi:hypothetical protein